VNPFSLFVRVLAAAVALAGLASCTFYEQPLRIALIRWPPFEFMHLAQEKGFFAEEGVEVRIIEFAAVNDTQRRRHILPVPSATESRRAHAPAADSNGDRLL
jgi:NitT/TauT family transport system substrate-binding protein